MPHSDKLDHILADEGANLSLGESVIYSTLQDDFKGTTVPAIAHRFNSLVDFDRILVLSDGEERIDGPFMDLLRGTGQENVQWFVEKVMAKQSNTEQFFGLAALRDLILLIIL
ncbi:hypothetical protein HDU86_007806 [Geranomyces michiganensis]|nr:hypothetical protein HDU86_007806 [Geranomyces michiganensis]